MPVCVTVLRRFRKSPAYLHVIYVGKFSVAVVEALRQHPDVDYVDEDTEVTTCMIATQYLFSGAFVNWHLSLLYSRNDAPWGLARINGTLSKKDVNDITYNYTYDMASEAGRGIDIYIVGGL